VESRTEGSRDGGPRGCGREPERPAEFKDLEKQPQRFEVIPRDANALKRYIDARAR